MADAQEKTVEVRVETRAVRAAREEGFRMGFREGALAQQMRHALYQPPFHPMKRVALGIQRWWRGR